MQSLADQSFGPDIGLADRRAIGFGADAGRRSVDRHDEPASLRCNVPELRSELISGVCVHRQHIWQNRPQLARETRKIALWRQVRRAQTIVSTVWLAQPRPHPVV